MLANILTVFKKEFGSYFRSHMGYIILIIYALLVLLSTFFATDFFNHTSETIIRFFRMQNNMLQFIIPALTMRLWADEQRQHTLEILLSQPISIFSMVMGKFLAAWSLSGLLLLSVSGLWLTTGLETTLDNYGIFISFVACLLLAGALCAICSIVSALTSNVFSSLVISLLICFFLGSLNLETLLYKASISNEIIIRSSNVLNFGQHFENIISGCLTVADIFYYLSFILFALWFNSVAVEYKRSKPRDRNVISVFGVLIVLSFLAINITVSLLGSAQVFDITANNKYSLSSATLDWLKNNDKNLYVRLYKSDNLKHISPELPEYAMYTLKLLEQYRQNSGNKLGIQVVETQPFSLQETEARNLGIRQLTSSGKETGFLGVVISDDSGNMRTIPYLNPKRQNYLEQDISRILSNLENSKRVDIGILSPAFKIIPSDDALDNTPLWPIADYLSRDYDLTYISPQAGQIPLNIDVLLVVNPIEMSNIALYAIDQYLLYGGRVIILLDNLSEYMTAQSIMPPQMLSVSYLPDFINQLGLEYAPDTVIADMQNARTAEIDNTKHQYPFWLDVNTRYFSEHKIMNGIKNITMNSPVGFNLRHVEGIKPTVLFSSSANSGEVNSAELSHSYLGQSLKTFNMTNRQYPLAVLLEGNFISYFKTPFVSSVNDIPFVSISVDEGKLLIVADSDMLMSSVWNSNKNVNQEWYDMLPQSGNLDFLQNAIDYLSPEKTLVSVPSKTNTNHTEALTALFSQQAFQMFENEQLQKQTQLKEIDDGLQKIALQIENNELIPSLKVTQNIETLERDKIKIRQELQKINYQTVQQFESVVNHFVIINLCLSFIFILIVGLIHTLIGYQLRRKAQGYVNG